MIILVIKGMRFRMLWKHTSSAIAISVRIVGGNGTLPTGILWCISFMAMTFCEGAPIKTKINQGVGNELVVHQSILTFRKPLFRSCKQGSF